MRKGKVRAIKLFPGGEKRSVLVSPQQLDDAEKADQKLRRGEAAYIDLEKYQEFLEYRWHPVMKGERKW